MDQTQKRKKSPIPEEKVFKIMFIVTVLVAVAFFFKNLIGKNLQGTVVIGASIIVFTLVFLIMRLKKASNFAKQMVLSVGLLILVFIISMNSGDYYSDDFIMFLAVIGMTGLYLEPRFTLVQIILADVFLVVMYLLHPDKAEALGQYIQCLVEFSLAGFLFRGAIIRGRHFIELGEDRAQEAEELLNSMQEMGESLERDFAKSSTRIENNTQELKRGSFSIVQSANDMTDECNDAQYRIQVSQQSIVELNDGVNNFEQALTENQANVKTMSEQLTTVSHTIYEANEVFQAMGKKMNEVASIAEQLNNISFNTTILSLNASIEAARAGEFGAGFAVVAEEMRQLSNNSNVFSEQVSEVVKELLKQVEATAEQFTDSTEALKQSRATMDELQESFRRLTTQFDSLYGNIEDQNSNVTEVNYIFNNLKEKVNEMHKYSEDNQGAVEAIVNAMDMYKVNINNVIESTRKIEE